ncbi:alpha/beta-hydrolase N-terminal domain-containing protein [Kocuria sp. CPCC 205263]
MDPGSSAPAVARSIGLVPGLGLSMAAVTPSLLPRPPVFQGFLAGVGFTLGCRLGVLLAGLVLRAAARRTRGPGPPGAASAVLLAVLLVVLGVLAVADRVYAARDATTPRASSSPAPGGARRARTRRCAGRRSACRAASSSAAGPPRHRSRR